MNAAQQSAIVAVGEINQLTGMHDRFVAELEIAAKLNSDIGSLAVSSAAITCDCLGHKVTASHRPIAIDGRVSAMEYDFTVLWNKEPLSILSLYLQPNGVVSHDHKGDSRFQDFNNSYMKNHILAAVCSALIQSPVFAAREV